MDNIGAQAEVILKIIISPPGGRCSYLCCEKTVPLATMSIPPLCSRSPEKFPCMQSALAYKTQKEKKKKSQSLSVWVSATSTPTPAIVAQQSLYTE